MATLTETILTPTAGRGHKTDIPALPSLSPSAVSQQVQAEGVFQMTHHAILKELREVAAGANYSLSDEDADTALWFLIDKRLRPGMSIRNSDLGDGQRFAVARSVKLGRWDAVQVTIVKEDD